MSLFRVKYLCFFFILTSIFSFFNIIYSYYFNLYLNLNTYYLSLILSLLIGAIFYKVKEINTKPTIFEKILTLSKKNFGGEHRTFFPKPKTNQRKNRN